MLLHEALYLLNEATFDGVYKYLENVKNKAVKNQLKDVVFMLIRMAKTPDLITQKLDGQEVKILTSLINYIKEYIEKNKKSIQQHELQQINLSISNLETSVKKASEHLYAKNNI